MEVTREDQERKSKGARRTWTLGRAPGPQEVTAAVLFNWDNKGAPCNLHDDVTQYQQFP